MRRSATLALIGVLLSTAAAAQPAARMATTVDALSRYPIFFHGRQVIVRGTVKHPATDVTTLRTDETAPPLFLLSRGGNVPDEGPVEVRGDFWDLGRLTADDPQLAGLNVEAVLARASEGRWPAQNQVPVLIVQSVAEPERLQPGLRALALEPKRWEGETITVIGCKPTELPTMRGA